MPAVQLSPTYVAWEGYERDTAEQTAALKASPSGKRYYATLRAWLADNDVQLPTGQLDGESLRAAVDAAASRTDRVHELRADVRSFGGAAIAADTVERLCG